MVPMSQMGMMGSRIMVALAMILRCFLVVFRSTAMVLSRLTMMFN
jgi:hypothetical protein